jgi:hypothetical protein
VGREPHVRVLFRYHPPQPERERLAAAMRADAALFCEAYGKAPAGRDRVARFVKALAEKPPAVTTRGGRAMREAMGAVDPDYVPRILLQGLLELGAPPCAAVLQDHPDALGL